MTRASRVIYRYSYVFAGELGPVRDSKAFQTEQKARTHASEMKKRGFMVIVWQERQFKNGNRWQSDFDDPLTKPLDP